MPYRVAVIHQGFVPVYRRGFFELLNSRRSGNEYVVVHGDPLRGSAHVALPEPYAFPHIRVRNLEVGLGRRRIVYQPVVRRVLREGYDALVVGHEIKFVSSMALFAAFKLLGRPALLWGHGYHRHSASLPARATSGLLARAADGYLAYTDSSAAHLRAIGVPDERITIVRNTIDTREQDRVREALAEADPAALRGQLGLQPASRVLLYVGRLEARKRAEDLVAATRALNEDPALRPVEAVIIGDGETRPRLERAAAGLPFIHLPGAIYDPFEVGKYMRIASAVVMPGQVGLGVNHAFSQGVPVVTRRGTAHSPEIEYIRPGVNGLLVADDGLAPFIDALRALLRDEALRSRLAAGALQTRTEISLEASADRFDAGVNAVIERQLVLRRARRRSA